MFLTEICSIAKQEIQGKFGRILGKFGEEFREFGNSGRGEIRGNSGDDPGGKLGTPIKSEKMILDR
jgi:hypothetical protein